MYMIYNIFNRIQEKDRQRKKQEQIFVNTLKNCQNYDISIISIETREYDKK